MTETSNARNGTGDSTRDQEPVDAEPQSNGEQQLRPAAGAAGAERARRDADATTTPTGSADRISTSDGRD